MKFIFLVIYHIIILHLVRLRKPLITTNHQLTNISPEIVIVV